MQASDSVVQWDRHPWVLHVHTRRRQADWKLRVDVLSTESRSVGQVCRCSLTVYMSCCPGVVWLLQMPARGNGGDTSPDTTVSDDAKMNFAPSPVHAMSKDPHTL